MSTYDPAIHGTYGQWLRDKSLHVKGDRTVPRRRETRDGNGRLTREVAELTDSGAVSIVRNRTDKTGGDHQDVHIHVPTLNGAAGALTPGVRTR